ncbi:hypothetical protein [Parasynechococcus sp.]|uniref:hypothetical protein n=1 Tax=Parasynechococcus sp. TaxID=3101203 RepID=UPI003703F6A2
MTALVAGLFWTPYADWIYTVVSLSGLMLVTWLVLGRSQWQLTRFKGIKQQAFPSQAQAAHRGLC